MTAPALDKLRGGAAALATYLERHDRRSLSRAIRLLDDAVRACPEDFDGYPLLFYNSALAWQYRYDLTDDDADLARAIDILRAGERRAAGGRHVGQLRYSLGAALRRTLRRGGGSAVADECVALLQSALELGHLADPVDARYEYAQALRQRAAAQRPGDGKDLDAAIDEFRTLTEDEDEDAADDPNRPAHLDGLLSALMDRYDRAERSTDLDEAERAGGRAVRLLQKQGRTEAPVLANFAGCLIKRAQQRDPHAPALLAEAEQLLETATRAASAGALPAVLNTQSAVLHELYDQTGRLDHLQRAVRLADEAVRATPADRPTERAVRLHHQALMHRTLALRRPDLDSLDAAVAAHTEALRLLTEDSPDWPDVVDSWANTLRAVYDRDHAAAVLDDAVTAYRRILGLPSIAPSRRAATLNNLSAILLTRSEIPDHRCPDDLERALAAGKAAVGLTAPGTADHQRALINYGNALGHDGRSVSPRHRRQALNAYREAWQSGVTGAATERMLQAALAAAEFCESEQLYEDAGTWLHRALDVADELVLRQRRHADKYSWVRDVGDAARRAVVLDVRRNDAAAAVVAAERGRSFALAQAITRREVDLRRLSTAGRDDLCARLEAASSATTEDNHGDFVQLRDEIRRVPGFEGFLAPPTFADIVGRVPDRALLYLIPGRDGGVALLVEEGNAYAVPLPGLTEQAVSGLAVRLLESGAADTVPPDYDGITETLGSLYLDAVLPRITPGTRVGLVAGGLLGVLPVHAATTSDPLTGAQRRLSDTTIVSCIPAARALGKGATQTEPVRLLSAAGLDGTEATLLRAELPAHKTIAGTRKRALDALSGTGVVHLDCHGAARLDEPLESCLYLDDGPLTARVMLTRRLHADLAVLSACESAVIGTALPDEAVGLPAALLEAGVAACVASLWPVPQRSTALFMALFYRRLIAGDDAAAAVRRAQITLRDATNDELAALFPKLITPPPGSSSTTRRIWGRGRPFRRVAHWAGFVYIG